MADLYDLKGHKRSLEVKRSLHWQNVLLWPTHIEKDFKIASDNIVISGVANYSYTMNVVQIAAVPCADLEFVNNSIGEK